MFLKVGKELLALGAAPSSLWFGLLLSFGEFYKNVLPKTMLVSTGPDSF